MTHDLLKRMHSTVAQTDRLNYTAKVGLSIKEERRGV